MAIFNCRKKDPILKLIRDTFEAYPLKVPGNRTQPLSVMSVHKNATRRDRLEYRGDFMDFILDTEEIEIALNKSKMANVSNTQSSQVNRNIGLNICSGFLNGFGLPSVNLSREFTEVQTVSFKFNNVLRTYFKETELGRKLRGIPLDMENPVMQDIKRNEKRLLLVSDVISSNNFTINANTLTDTNFTFNIDNIQKIIGDASASMKATTVSGKEITFQGDTQLTFAISCIELFVSNSGKIEFSSPFESEFEALSTPKKVSLWKEEDSQEESFEKNFVEKSGVEEVLFEIY